MTLEGLFLITSWELIFDLIENGGVVVAEEVAGELGVVGVWVKVVLGVE